MKIDDTGIAIEQAFEGCLAPLGNGRFKPYYCPAGVLTIGCYIVCFQTYT